MKRINYHGHTALCRHAGGNCEDYVKEAIEKKLDILGISEHAPYPDDRHGLHMLYEELEPYMEDLRRLKKEYQGQLELYAGLEIEYDPKMTDYYHWLLDQERLDYLILGQHFYPSENDTLVNIYAIETEGDTSNYVEYAKSLKAGMETGLFKILAHPDVIFINNLPWDENCEKACDIIIQAAKDTGTILELNANGIRRGKQMYCDGERYPYPYMGFWNKLSNSSLPVIVSSDCHNPYKLWDECVEEAYEIAKELNLNLVDEIDMTKPKKYPL